MKKELHLTWMALLLCLAGWDIKAEDYTKTMVRKGLPAKVTIRVHDPDGNPVSDAPVKFVFGFANKTDLNIVKGKTDASGMASGEGLGNDKVVIHVDKPGWYRPECDYSLRGSGKSYQTGRWEPWNPMLDITLYPKLNQRPAPKERSCYYEHLEQDTVYGFDMLKKDIVKPNGKGDVADFQFRGKGIYKTIIGEDRRDTNTFYTNDLEVAFQNVGDGVVRMKKHLDSEFRFTYLAPETGYEQNFNFHSDYSRRGHTSTFPSNDEYLIFRVSRKDERTGEIRRYYGIITRFCGGTNNKGEFELDIWYCLNPDPEDRNLEYGP